jgi:hypothetical protein
MIFWLLSTLVVNHGEAPRRSFGLGQIERNLLLAEALKVGLYQHQSSDPSKLSPQIRYEDGQRDDGDEIEA